MRGLPSTVTWLGTGTIVSPWLPSVMASTASGETPSFSAVLSAKRALSSMPAWPMTRSCGRPETRWNRAVISSSGFVTTITTASGERSATSCATRPTILAFSSSRSMRLIPGLRGLPAVTTTTSLPVVGP